MTIVGKTSSILSWTHLPVAAAILALGISATPVPVAAQLAPWGGNSNVLVDQSVGGLPSQNPSRFGSATTFSGQVPGGALLPPPTSTPRSTLLTNRAPVGSPVGAEPDLPKVTLKRPSAQTASRPAARATPRPAQRAPVAKVPAAPKIAALPKAPAPAPVTPKPPTPLAKPAPIAPAPAPVVKAPPPAPKVAAVPKAPTPPPATPKPSAAPKPPAVAAPPAPPKAAPPAAPATPAPQQQASRTPAAEPAAPIQNITFKAGEANLSDNTKKVLDSVAAKLAADPNLRMQLLAYAGEPNLSASKARRLSLSRALAVRSHLIGKGVRSTRIDVRALGNKVPGGQPNRVDLRTLTR